MESSLAPSVEAPGLIDVIGGEPGLIEHILTLLANDESTSAERVAAGTSAIRWLQVCKETEQLVTPALWVLLTATYYPNYPLPKFGCVSASTLFREMWSRHNEFAKAKAIYERLHEDFQKAVVVMNADWNTVRCSRSRRAKWEIGESLRAAESDMEWQASFLKTWYGALKTVPVQRQNAGVVH